MCDGSTVFLTLLKWRHQPAGEAVEQSEEEQTLGLEPWKVTKGQLQENFLSNQGMKKKQVVATERTGEMQMSLASATTEKCSATVRYIMQYTIVPPLVLYLCASSH